MAFFYCVIDIIQVYILEKNSCSVLRNLIKNIKFHQFLKNQNQIEIKKIRRPTWYF